MPYVNIPESKLVSTIASLVGKIQGDVIGKVIKRAGELETKFRSEGCPTNLGRIRSQLNGLNSSIGSINGKLSKFKKLPQALKAPVGGLKAAKNIILTLPIPQAVPPGIGIPVSITTKYADLLHLLKEFIKQISDDIDGLTHVLDTGGPSSRLQSIDRAFKKIEVSLKACEIEKAILDKVEEGELTRNQLIRLGLIDIGRLRQLGLDELEKDEEEFTEKDTDGLLVSNLGPSLLGNGCVRDNRTVSQMAKESGLTNDEMFEKIKNTTNDQCLAEVEDNFNQALGTVNLALKNLEGTQLELDPFVGPTEEELDSDKFTHFGPNGEPFFLAIETDTTESFVAPRRFAIAKDKSGVIVLKGPKSFSSSVDVLLNEIKFRIDNQLP